MLLEKPSHAFGEDMRKTSKIHNLLYPNNTYFSVLESS
jgi:hypothetical protein